ncbi:hypothetical protein DFS34DRAFT_647838 [Phlyctochytrium arcticum]|nr:hypothetical protein DFS34DRAFT_647838 [Phlyctochytrium arcticum]
MREEAASAELISALQEFAGRVRPGSLSAVATPASSQGQGLKLCLLEGVWLQIQLTDQGFVIVHASNESEEDASIPPIVGHHMQAGTAFESLAALLDTISPLSRDRMAEDLYAKLLAVENHSDDEQDA